MANPGEGPRGDERVVAARAGNDTPVRPIVRDAHTNNHTVAAIKTATAAASTSALAPSGSSVARWTPMLVKPIANP